MNYVHSHNDFWNQNLAYGQWFVAKPRLGAADYDCAYEMPVIWFARSPYRSNSLAHKIYNMAIEQAAKMSAENLNQAR